MLMNCPGNELLASSAFALDQDSGFALGHDADRLEDLFHRPALSDNIGVSKSRRKRNRSLSFGSSAALAFENAPNRGFKFIDLQRLMDVFDSTQFHRSNCCGHIVKSGNHNDAGVGISILDTLEYFKSICIGKQDVQNDDVPGLGLILLQTFQSRVS